MQQRSIKEWFQKLLKIFITNCLTKVYIEAYGEQIFAVN